jgi:hypothetical protein
MVEKSATRRSPRYPIVLPLIYEPKAPAPAQAGRGYSCSLSEGGACLELAESLAPGTHLRLVLLIHQSGLALDAEVLWVGRPGVPSSSTLHGVGFTGVTPEQRQALQELIQRLAKLPQQVPRLPIKIPVWCRPTGSAGAPLCGWTDDISRDGLAVLLPGQLPVGTGVEVGLTTPQGTFSAEATVVWLEPADRLPGGELTRHGVRFTTLNLLQDLLSGLPRMEIAPGSDRT